MNIVTSKVDIPKGKGRSKTRNIKKSMFLRAPAAAMTVEEQELLRAANEAREEWIETNTKFDYVYEEKLVDYYTYKMKACEARYAYFINLVKEKGLSQYI